MLTSSVPSPDMEKRGLLVAVVPLLLSTTMPPLAPAFSKMRAFSANGKWYQSALFATCTTYMRLTDKHTVSSLYYDNLAPKFDGIRWSRTGLDRISHN